MVQGKEPEHFYRIFQGKMLILRGGVDSGFNRKANLSNANSFGDNMNGAKGLVQLYQVKQE